ncbi:hypothetical protein Trydic_g18813 [Trypoxylus dichotomus]
MWSASRKGRCCTLTRDVVCLGAAVTHMKLPRVNMGRMLNLYKIMTTLGLRTGLKRGDPKVKMNRKITNVTYTDHKQNSKLAEPITRSQTR